MPAACPSCGAADSFVACGPGVERIADEVAARFPEARRLILSSDHVAGPAAFAQAVAAIGNREIDVVIGTQVVAKGHHFPGLTLVGVVDSDIGLAGGDLRAAERTFQMLHQVAGRAGRAERPGRVLLQTYDPDQAVIAALASADRDAFVAAEQAGRRALGMPPFGRLAAVIAAARSEDEAAKLAAALGRAFPDPGGGVKLYGPAARASGPPARVGPLSPVGARAARGADSAADARLALRRADSPFGAGQTRHRSLRFHVGKTPPPSAFTPPGQGNTGRKPPLLSPVFRIRGSHGGIFL